MSSYNNASLAVYSESAPASEVTDVLGLSPATIHEKGDRRRGNDGREYAPFSTSVWIYRADESLIDPDDDSGFAALRALVAVLHDRAGALASLRLEYQTVIWWSGNVSPQGNFVIDADLIVDLGLLGCEFYGTAYPEDGVEPSS